MNLPMCIYLELFANRFLYVFVRGFVCEELRWRVGALVILCFDPP